MRFHATVETAEGQCYDALQQGAPQQPVVLPLLYLPFHKSGGCEAMCEAESSLRRALASPVGTATLQMSRAVSKSALRLPASDVRRVSPPQ